MKSEVVSFRQNPGNGRRDKTGEGQQVAVPCSAMRSTLGQRDVFDAYHVTFAWPWSAREAVAARRKPERKRCVFQLAHDLCIAIK